VSTRYKFDPETGHFQCVDCDVPMRNSLAHDRFHARVDRLEADQPASPHVYLDGRVRKILPDYAISIDEYVRTESTRKTKFEELICRLALEAGCKTVTVDWGGLFHHATQHDLGGRVVEFRRDIDRLDRIVEALRRSASDPSLVRFRRDDEGRLDVDADEICPGSWKEGGIFEDAGNPPGVACQDCAHDFLAIPDSKIPPRHTRDGRKV
jgi:hypothetical protein